jgi:hypothetical protein
LTLTAGYDIVTEISKKILLNLVKWKLTIHGVPINPPFELNLPISSGGIIGILNVIVHKLSLDHNKHAGYFPVPEDSLTMEFIGSSFRLSNPKELVITSLEGTIKISAPIRVIGSSLVLDFDYKLALVAITFTEESLKKITHALSETPII